MKIQEKNFINLYCPKYPKIIEIKNDNEKMKKFYFHKAKGLHKTFLKHQKEVWKWKKYDKQNYEKLEHIWSVKKHNLLKNYFIYI